ncbi:MAG TPA: phosphate ABC transporter permease subunit PstC [Candidatus Saccharicenans sp.]|jgi:phosphate transport system permease protein|nr:phosphate ABC transporter permease subunit PstC [Candidatus Saccharicenans sp.]HRD01518.1 phosphate ABC transporter permease subunit PstC [Candidatus Saccharicenans sp.]
MKQEKGRQLAAGLFAFFPIFLIISIFLLLLLKAFPLLSLKSLPGVLFSSAWQPQKGQFGLWPFILGTLWVTITAFILAAPLSILTAIYISDYASGRLKKWLAPVLDLLAGLPSVIYGMWGILLIVPLVGKYLAPLFGTYTSGYCVLTAGIVLAVMILPTIVNVSAEVLSAVPADLKEAALALGATRLEVVRHVVLKKSLPGVAAACVLGLSRAFGETLAVMMVVGNVPVAPTSLFSPAYPLPALLANNYGEMLSIPGYEAALNLAAIILLLMVIIFSLGARLYLTKLGQRSV